ncbi:MAG TPA: cytochrome c oxidase subunit 3 [Bryobacteraceae bacterium]|jgi:cytochrome c oxidase subunit 3|nr:cytochrome c oxidase subunit 3 [Bryobacteraceae bacterium]
MDLVRGGVAQGPPPPPLERGWGGDDGFDGRGADRRTSFVGLVILLVSTFIVFSALLIAFLARRAMGDDWISMHKPALLWVNTGVLIVSSIVLDKSRRALKARDRSKFNLWWTTATALGGVFLIGQLIVWSQLRAAGVYVATNPASSFFYVLTAVHAAHLIGGMTALIWVDVQALRLQLGPAKRTAIDICAIFWHYLDGLWLVLMACFYIFG